jgi:hypothetical protein
MYTRAHVYMHMFALDHKDENVHVDTRLYTCQVQAVWRKSCHALVHRACPRHVTAAAFTLACMRFLDYENTVCLRLRLGQTQAVDGLLSLHL